MTKCFILEENRQMTHYKTKVTKQVQPILEQSYGYVLVLLHNLAVPQWLPVNCNEKLLPNIACVSQYKVKKRKIQQSTSKVCKKRMILFNRRFFLFLYSAQTESQGKHSKHIFEKCKTLGMKLLKFHENTTLLGGTIKPSVFRN